MIIAALSLGSTAAQASLQGGYIPTDDDVNEIAKKLYCPVCPNTPLDVCETKACQDWRSQIRGQLESGWSEDQIIDYFIAQYGERVLAEPRMGGFTSLVWFLPLIALAAGLFVLRQLLFRWRIEGDPAESDETGSELEIPVSVLSRIESELDELR